MKNTIEIASINTEVDGYDFTTPLYLAKSLMQGEASFLKRNCTQFFVCNFYHLKELLERIEEAVGKDIQTIKQVVNIS